MYKTENGKIVEEIYFAGGCFWGTERLFQSVRGVVDTQCGYANGKREITPDYKRVCRGDTGYRETVKVVYDPGTVSLVQLLAVFFHVIDPTVEKQQGPDKGDQYQTGVYYTNDKDQAILDAYVKEEKKKYDFFATETEKLSVFVPAEEYHQDYLIKNPDGYCHISRHELEQVQSVADRAAEKKAEYSKPDEDSLRRKLTKIQYEVTQHAATEHPFTGEYWNTFEKGIYVDVTTGQPLFSSEDKYLSSCGWPSFCAPLTEKNLLYHKDESHNMIRTEVKSQAGDAHLGHIFYGEPESPNGVRYCINSAALKFIPYEKMKEEGYGEWMKALEKNDK